MSLYLGFLWRIAAQLGLLPPASLTLGLMELQGASAGQSDFGPGLGTTDVLSTTRETWVPFCILSTWIDMHLCYLGRLEQVA